MRRRRIGWLGLAILVTAGADVAAAGENRELVERAAELRDHGLESDLAYEVLRSLTTEVGPRLLRLGIESLADFRRQIPARPLSDSRNQVG